MMTPATGFQKLRFHADDGSEFPEWKETEIKDIITIFAKKVSSDSDLPILTSSKANGIQYQDEHFSKNQQHDIDGYNVVPWGYCTYRNRSDGTDFTFNINKLCNEGIVSKFYPVFTGRNTDTDFLATFLNNEPKTVRKIAVTAKGTGQKVLSISDLQRIAIIIPSLPEQQKIAAFLSAYEKKISLQKERLETLKEQKKGLLQKMFPKKGETVPELRFPGFTGDWERRKLGEVVDVRSGKDYKHLSEGNIPVYGTGGYMLSVNEALSYSEDAIGIGRKGTIDKPYILKAPFWTVDTLFYAVPRANIDLDFVFDIFQNIDWKKRDESTGVPSLSKAAINEIDILVPHYAEQCILGKCFYEIDNLITLHQRKLETMQEIKKGLLRQMFC